MYWSPTWWNGKNRDFAPMLGRIWQNAVFCIDQWYSGMNKRAFCIADHLRQQKWRFLDFTISLTNTVLILLWLLASSPDRLSDMKIGGCRVGKSTPLLILRWNPGFTKWCRKELPTLPAGSDTSDDCSQVDLVNSLLSCRFDTGSKISLLRLWHNFSVYAAGDDCIKPISTPPILASIFAFLIGIWPKQLLWGCVIHTQ